MASNLYQHQKENAWKPRDALKLHLLLLETEIKLIFSVDLYRSRTGMWGVLEGRFEDFASIQITRNDGPIPEFQFSRSGREPVNMRFSQFPTWGPCHWSGDPMWSGVWLEAWPYFRSSVGDSGVWSELRKSTAFSPGNLQGKIYQRQIDYSSS